MSERSKVIHVSTWDEFKKLAVALQPALIAYTVQTSPLSRPPLGLGLIFAAEGVQYVFLDFAHGASFGKTKLPVYAHESGNAYFKEEDLKSFIRAELNRKNINIVSFEILGY